MRDVLEKIKNGDHDAYREIVREYGPAIRVYLASRLSDLKAVDDLSQEVFIAAYWNIDRFDLEKDFGLWLRGIARNKVLGHLRKVYSENRVKEELMLSIENSLNDELDSFNENEREVFGRLTDCMGKLPPELHEIVQCRYYKKESVISMADRLKSTVSAISSKLYRVRKQLRICVESEVEL